KHAVAGGQRRVQGRLPVRVLDEAGAMRRGTDAGRRARAVPLGRWRWDLNPRTACTVTRFRGVRPRPLGDSTGAPGRVPDRRAGRAWLPAARGWDTGGATGR